MEGCQICRMLWCLLLLLGTRVNVWATEEPPLKAVTQPTDSADKTAAASPFNVSNPTDPAPSSDITAPSDITHPGSCFRWFEWEGIAVVGGAVLTAILLVSTVALAFWVCQLKRQVRGSRPPRTNVDLVSGMGYPTSSGRGSRKVVSSRQAEGGVKMEEVKQTKEDGEVAEQEAAGGGWGDAGNGESGMSSAQSGTASQSVASPAGSSKEETEVLVVV